ncbi:MAG: amino acid adenylation domain-containing protein [Planctomycetes bacterium]|nr:amino acid adenylation domain-containing protein [Planctomycetota bacterium]
MTHSRCNNLAEHFISLATARPGAPALRTDDADITYGQLDALSNQVAHRLVGAGLRRGSVLAIFHDKSAWAYAGMLAALKLGSPYVNLDSNSPPHRLQKILDRCGPTAVWTSQDFGQRLDDVALPAGTACIAYDEANTQAAVRRCPDDPPPGLDRIHGNTPAYIMFTSGSTGFPKGATMTHANVLNFVIWARDTFDITYEDVLTGANPPYFDNSVFDVYGSLFNGAMLAPLTEEIVRQPMQLVRAATAAGCTIWFSVPSLLVYVLRMRALTAESLPALRAMSFGGEGFPKAQLRTLYGLLGHRVRLVNVYGPTECTCICSSYDVSPADLVPDELLPLGHIAPNFDYVILDGNNNATPTGEVGELCLIGPNVGKGYWRDPQRTAGSFVQNPLNDAYPETVYRTGDLVRLNPQTGHIHFCGRKDNQIKHMGYRIELEEIEAALGSLDAVDECAVIYHRPDERPGRIVAFAVAPTAAPDDLLDTLREKLPTYMIPNELQIESVLPKNRNGKVNRLALKEQRKQQGVAV